MATNTTNYGWTKPDYEDDADIAVLNETFDAIDAQLKANENNISTANAELIELVDSGITSALVTQIGTNTTAIAGKASQADLTALEAEVDDKADASDVATETANLQAQIDNIVTPVTQDAEVQNARVGADGTSYVSLKARLDTENNSLNDDLAEVDNFINSISIEVNPFYFSDITDKDVTLAFNNNGYLTITGTASGSGFITTNAHMYLTAGTWYINITDKSGTKSTLYFYDENNTQIGQLAQSSTSNMLTISADGYYNVRAYVTENEVFNFVGAVMLSKGDIVNFEKHHYELKDNEDVTALQTEVENARVALDGTSYSSLKSRLDAQQFQSENNNVSIVVSDNKLKPEPKTENSVTIGYNKGFTSISGTASNTAWVNIGWVLLEPGTYYFAAGSAAGKPVIYLRDKDATDSISDPSHNIGYIRATYRTSSAITISQKDYYRVDAYITASETYSFNDFLQLGTTSEPAYDAYHKELDSDFKKPFGNLKYEAIGDSLTYGFIGFDGGGSQLRLENPYCSRVGQLLGFNSVENKGETGTTIANDLDKMGTYKPMSNDQRLATYVTADVISIMGGTNDYLLGCELGTLGNNDDSTFYGGFEKIIKYLRTNNANSFIFVIIPPSTHGFNTKNVADYSAKDYRDATINVCEEYGVPYIDMTSNSELSNFNRSTWTVDGTHFSQDYTDKIFAPIIADFINQHYNRSQNY